MKKKFELMADNFIEVFGMKLFRIRALISFGIVTKGEMGGYVEKESNVSQDGNAWVSGDAQVFGNAWVSGNAQVFGNAWVFGDARVSGDAQVSGNAQVSGDAQVFGNAWVSGNAQVSGNAWVFGDARVSGDARVFGDARVSGDAQVFGNARVFGNAWVSGDAQVSGNASIFWASKVGSEQGTLTVFRGKIGLLVTRGCFIGTDDEFLARVDEVHGSYSKIGKEYHLLIEVARSRIDTTTKIEELA